MPTIGLFIFEKRIYKSLNGAYYDTVFTNSVLARYTAVVDKLIIAARVDLLSESEEEIRNKYSYISLPNVEVVEIDNVMSMSGLLHSARTKKIIYGLIDQSDVIFIRVPSFWQSSVVKYANKKNKKYILEVGADAWATYWNIGLKGKLVAPYIENSTKKVIKYSKFVVYVTNEWLQNRYPTNGESIACSNADIQLQGPDVLDSRIEMIHNLNRPITIGTLASVSNKAKGQQFVIQALGLMKKEGECPYIYRLAGTGNQDYLRSVAIENNVEELVFFDGQVRHDKIGEWFANIDLYVQPSRQEGLPRSLIEAESYAIPAFGARTGGIPELLEEDVIFSNTKNNLTEIIEILKSYDKPKMEEKAKLNFKKSKQYEARIINERRNAFFKKIMEEK